MNPYLAARPRAGAALRLFCFHHAGAGAMTFARWQARMGPGVSVLPVRLPGRETRLNEPRITDAEELVDELERHLAPLLETPYVLYGHSLGALVANRLAAHRARAGSRPPEELVVGACRAPHEPNPLHGAAELDDEQMLRMLQGFGGVPEAMLERPDWLRTMLATMRADLQLAGGLRTLGAHALPCPVRAYAGRDDRMAPAASMQGWARYTASAFRFHTVAGGHFFVRDRELPDLLGRSLTLDGPLSLVG